MHTLYNYVDIHACLYLTFGHSFNKLVEYIALPSSLQNLTFGYSFTQRMDYVVLPIGLQNLQLAQIEVPRRSCRLFFYAGFSFMQACSTSQCKLFFYAACVSRRNCSRNRSDVLP